MPKDTLPLFFAANYFAQGMSGIAFEPIAYLLKDGLGLGAAQSARFVSLMTLPFLLKPLFGALSDSRLFSSRRQALVAAGALSAAAWLALAALGRPGYGAALALILAANVGLVLSDAACDGLMVERGTPSGRTAFYQAVQIATLYGALVVTGLGGGWLSAHAPTRAVFLLSAGFSVLSLAAAWLFAAGARGERAPLLPALRGLAGDRRFWAVSAFIFLWSFAPFLGTAQFYYQSEALALSPVFIGAMSTLGGACGLLGAAAFGRWSSRGDPILALRGAVWVFGPLSLLYLAYRGPWAVAAVTAALAFCGTFFRLAIMDLAARSCPPGGEATAFAAYMAVFNLAAWASNGLGGTAYGSLSGSLGPHGAAAALVLTGTCATLLSGALLPALRRPS